MAVELFLLHFGWLKTHPIQHRVSLRYSFSTVFNVFSQDFVLHQLSDPHFGTVRTLDLFFY